MLGIEPDKSLFEILCDNLKTAKTNYDVYIPWYIMTSRENNKQTMEFFEKNNYFNYPKDKIKFFVQGELPMVGTDGKILLDKEGIIKEAADGHGGIFEAMFKNNVVEDMKNNGVEWIFVGPVDNPLVKMVDEILIGVAVDKKVLAIGKSLVKANPKEKVGVFCKKNGKPAVIEYTEISDEMAEEKDKNGNLVYGESHINCNMFNIKAIEYYLTQQNIKTNLIQKSINDDIDLSHIDLIYIGCSTETNQLIGLNHLKQYKEELKDYIENNKFIIATGNSFELFGKIIHNNSKEVKGLNIFDYQTIKTEKRIIHLLYYFVM